MNSLLDRLKRYWWVLTLIVLYFVSGSPYFFQTTTGSPAEIEGQVIFETNCISCHTIGGGDLVGPDLQDVLERRDREWLLRFIQIPDIVIAEGDPIALDLLAEFNNTLMPNLSLNESQTESVLAYYESVGIEAEIVEQLPPGDSSAGAAYFTGKTTFENNGTPCIGCHSVDGSGSYGGGTLGPDLTQVYQRFGKEGLSAAILNISFPTMIGVYEAKSLNNEEVADLVAFFESSSISGGEGNAQQSTGIFWAVGLLGSALLFAVMAIFWPKQRESLSDRLRKQA